MKARARSLQMVAMTVLAVVVAGARPAAACESIHSLLLFPGEPPDQPRCGVDDAAFVCQDGGAGQPVNCRSCNPANFGAGLCWASKCRNFDGDNGQFGQFKKDGKGELEAIVMEITNTRTGVTKLLVDKVANPDCQALIDSFGTPSTDVGTCSAKYKVKDHRPAGSSRGFLCTWDDLDDVNLIAREKNLLLTDAVGNSCPSRPVSGDQWWMYYQDCCTNVAAFGQPGDGLFTTTTLILHQDRTGGGCVANLVKPDQSRPEIIPEDISQPCS